jgi:polyribonucleotide nucleotidyltransferase
MASNRAETPMLDIYNNDELAFNLSLIRRSKLLMPSLDKKRKAKEISPNRDLITTALHNAILALERAQNTINNKNMRDQIEYGMKIIPRIINDIANTESNTQSTSESAVEPKTQAKIDKLHEKIDAKLYRKNRIRISNQFVQLNQPRKARPIKIVNYHGHKSRADRMQTLQILQNLQTLNQFRHRTKRKNP